jgi:tetratricopeptide (TPR) repeat protein
MGDNAVDVSDSAPASADDELLASLRALRIAEPTAGVKPLVAKLKESHPDCKLGAKEVREMLRKLEAEQKAAEAAAPSSSSTPAASQTHVKFPFTCSKCGAGMPLVIATCSLCKAHEYFNETCPTYCSEKCRRKDTVAHRTWHREMDIKIEHTQDALHNQRMDVTQKLLREVKDDYDLQNVAGCELMEANPRAAVDKFNALIKQRPWEPEAYFNLGAVYLSTGDRARALVAFQSAYEWHDEGNMGWAQSAVMVHQCVTALKARGRNAKTKGWSEPEWHKDPGQLLNTSDWCIAVNGDDDGSWLLRADALERLGRKQEAAEAYEKAKARKRSDWF